MMLSEGKNISTMVTTTLVVGSSAMWTSTFNFKIPLPGLINLGGSRVPGRFGKLKSNNSTLISRNFQKTISKITLMSTITGCVNT